MMKIFALLLLSIAARSSAADGLDGRIRRSLRSLQDADEAAVFGEDEATFADAFDDLSMSMLTLDDEVRVFGVRRTIGPVPREIPLPLILSSDIPTRVPLTRSSMAERLPRKSSKKNIATWYQWVVKVARLDVGSAINNWNVRGSKLISLTDYLYRKFS